MLPMVKKKDNKSDSCCSKKTDCCATNAYVEEKSDACATSQQEGAFNFDYEGNKIHFISLGCPRNLVDSEVMLGILMKAGYEVTEELQEADFLVINTCGFLEASRKESMDTVRETLAQRKKTAKLVVTGCMVQTHHDEMQKQFPGIDYLLGSGDVQGILQAVQSTQKGKLVSTARSFLENGEIPRQISTPKHYAYLKIAEGCRKRCSYCVIPTIKGPLKSKNKEQIMREFHHLLNEGVHEIILIAQDLGDYGKDFGSKNQAALIDLLQSMLAVDKKFWLRLLYLYPDEITDELIALIKSDARVCPYLDMPIQHINNAMLKSMRRATSKEDIIETITKLRKEIPDIVIRTSLIVGFPGETEEQFEELAQFIQEYPLDNIGIFKYSREPGSHSYDLPNQIDDEIKEKRYHQLMKIQQKVVKKRNARYIGKKLPVVLEGYHPETNLLMVGRFYGQCPEIDGQVIINDGRKVKAFGQMYTLEVTEVAGYDLVGRVL
jgi:ribosomal protein S12 methylthiotransferase